MSRVRIALVLSALGCAPAPAPPAPTPPPEAPVAEVRQAVARADMIEVCVLHRGKLLNVRAELLATGDTVVGGRPFSAVYADTGQYAATREWYVNNETIDYDPRNVCYMKFGLPRYIARENLVRMGEWRGVPAFRGRSDDWDLPDAIWVPTGPGCWFQGYQFDASSPPRPCPQPEYRFQVP